MRTLIVALCLLASAAAEPHIDDASDDGVVPVLDIDDVDLFADDAFLNISMSLNMTPAAPGAQTCTDQTVKDVPEVGDVPVCIYAGLDLNYQVAFWLEGPEGRIAPEGAHSFETIAWFGNSSAPYEFRLFTRDVDGALVDSILIEGRAEEGIRWSIPLELLGIDPGPREAPIRLKEPVAWTQAYACGGPLFCLPLAEPDDVSDPTSPTFKPLDRAPDEGAGDDFLLPYTEPEPEQGTEPEESAGPAEPAPAEPAPAEPSPTEPVSVEPEVEPEGTEHSKDELDGADDDKESPGLPLFALLVGLALLARRQR